MEEPSPCLFLFYVEMPDKKRYSIKDAKKTLYKGSSMEVME